MDLQLSIAGPSNAVDKDKVKIEAASSQINIKQETQENNRAPALPIEDEPEYDDTLCILDWCMYYKIL